MYLWIKPIEAVELFLKKRLAVVPWYERTFQITPVINSATSIPPGIPAHLIFSFLKSFLAHRRI